MNTSDSTPRVCVVTGATGMLGQATALDLASRGASVIVVCKDRERGTRILDELQKSYPDGARKLVIGDLSEPESVRAVAAQIRKETDKIHALIHAAAVLTHERHENKVGQELMFATNVLARVLLTHELLPHAQSQQRLWEESKHLLSI